MTNYYNVALTCVANRRVKQTITPFIILTEFDKTIIETLNKIAESQYQKTLVTNVESPEGQYLQILIDLMNEPLPEIQSKNIKDALQLEGIERSTSSITRCLKGIGFTQKQSGISRKRILHVEPKYFKKIVEKYVSMDGQVLAIEIFEKWHSGGKQATLDGMQQERNRVAVPYKSQNDGVIYE